MAEVQASTGKARQHAVLLEKEKPKKPSSRLQNKKTSARKLQISPEEIYCRLSQMNTRLPLSGELQILGFSYDVDEENQSGWTAMIRSSECPESSFSKIRINSNNEIKELVDCRMTSQEELLIHSGIQGNIIDVPRTSRREFNLAISGSGFLVVKCASGLQYIRDGHFFMNDEGQLETSSSCQAISDKGVLIQMSVDPIANDQGCFEDGTCLAIVQPEAHDISIADHYSLWAKTDPLTILASDKKIFVNALEDLTVADAGPLGPDWDRIPTFTRPISCPQEY